MSNVSINLVFATAAAAAAFLTKSAADLDKAGASVSTASGTASGKVSAGTTETKAVAPKHTLEEVQALLGKLAGKFSDKEEGKKAARDQFNGLGYKTSKEIKPEHLDQVFAAAEAALAKAEAAVDEEV